MTDTAPDVAAIRAALAQGPTPGRWELWGKPDPSQVIAAGNGFVAQTLGGNDLPNASYIAVCHPERIARLLDALELAQRDAERYRWLAKQTDTATNLVQYRDGIWHTTVPCHSGHELGAAIDAATAAAPQQAPTKGRT